MSAVDEVIALLAARVVRNRVGKVAWREMDQDILAMRKAIELLEAPPSEEMQAAQDFFQKHYPRFGEWRVDEFELTVMIPASTGTREESLELIQDALAEAGWDIRAVER
ncbi:hypothetical protein HOT29_gp069 [Microbacterium phage Squash]|uniref:Uncharacterized protein n=1 Tax=Microbacterium phage Squash TaxID=2182357 RepID=A0A2U8UM52_9CAUD|nr:hypothetical protein HOT29_gp069 [Microbacterium phage Squash]AWN04688.1 hypothetical protein PBI_SQUASH_69 [Microbacterium phage Squash]